MSTAGTVAITLVRVLCYGTSALALVAWIVCGEKRTSDGVKTVAGAVVGSRHAFEVGFFFVCAALVVAAKLFPGDAKRLWLWNERRDGRDW